MFRDLLKDNVPQGELSVIRKAGPFRFACLVAESVKLVAELDILMLRPEPPGSIVTQGGDIDNRIKTLLDGLKAPLEPNALPQGVAPGSDQDPFFCLLEDDHLITRLSVQTDRLLEPVATPAEVVLVIHVTTKQLGVMIDTIGLA